jgi:hypothetical protein
METEIKVELALINAKLPLRALADVILRWSGGELTLRRCAVFEKPGAAAWATFPQLPIEKNGKRQFVPLVDLTRDLRRRVLDAVLAEYRRKIDAR